MHTYAVTLSLAVLSVSTPSGASQLSLDRHYTRLSDHCRFSFQHHIPTHARPARHLVSGAEHNVVVLYASLRST